MGTRARSTELEALRSGRAFVDLAGWRKVLVRGGDARGWLNDLLSAELSGLAEGATRRSLLLSPTGRIRADVTVASARGGTLLLQDPIQPASIGELLSPYVLSSDVELADVTSVLALVAVPGGEPPAVPEAEVLRPSALGPGADLVAAATEAAAVRGALAGLVEAGPDAAEVWRIERGVARLGVDLEESSLPHEAALDHAVAYGKGCFLGQEAVAKIRNLGHPPFVVLAADGRGPVTAGQAVTADGEAVGAVTSAAPVNGGRTAAILRVRWTARHAALRTETGTPLRPLGPASGAA